MGASFVNHHFSSSWMWPVSASFKKILLPLELISIREVRKSPNLQINVLFWKAQSVVTVWCSLFWVVSLCVYSKPELCHAVLDRVQVGSVSGQHSSLSPSLCLDVSLSRINRLCSINLIGNASLRQCVFLSHWDTKCEQLTETHWNDKCEERDGKRC